MSALQVTYKTRTVEGRRKHLLAVLEAQDQSGRDLKEEIRSASNDIGGRDRFKTIREFQQWVAGRKHKLALLKVEREKTRRQISRCNRIMERMRADNGSGLG